MNLEDELRGALQREDPSEGFAERVIRQAGPARAQFRQAAPKRTLRWLWPAVASLTAVAAAAVVLSLSVHYRQAQEERTQEEKAGRQAIMAIQIVAEELNMAQNEVLNQ